MSVKARRTESGSWEVDLHVVLPTGRRYRERRRLLVSSKSAALEWGRVRERTLLTEGLPSQTKEVPTLEAFAPRFLEGHAQANQHKPSGIAAKETILRVHLLPPLGGRRLDAITTEDIQQLKSRLSTKSPKTVNNILTTLNTLLKVAVEWKVLDEMPCTIRLLKVTRPVMEFHDFEAFERLVEAARETDGNTLLIALLGGQAGLRCGEMMALEWSDVSLGKRQICVRRSEWKGQVTAPKGGRLRYVPMTARLADALRRLRNLRWPRVLVEKDGRTFTQKMVQDRVRWAARRGAVKSGVHILRHTFCSHLAMRGAPAKAIQELAGHQNLSTTERYMHLSPAARDSAIRLLEQPIPGSGGGEDTSSSNVRFGNVLTQ